MGSISNKKLELQYVDIFAYDDIFGRAKEYIRSVKEYYSKNDKRKISDIFKEVSRAGITEYLCKTFMDDCDGYIEFILKDKILLDSKTNLNLFFQRFAYIESLVRSNYSPSAIFSRYTPTANGLSKNNSDTEFIKLKYSVLGIRFKKENNKLLICGPTGHINACKKIRKEKFSWKLSKYSL